MLRAALLRCKYAQRLVGRAGRVVERLRVFERNLFVVLAVHDQERTAHFLHHAVEPERLELFQCGIERIDAKRIGIVAISLGGYYAPRCAALEPRFAACIAWGAIWDYYGTWKKRIDAGFKASMSVPGHHIMWILGVDTLDAALKKLEPFRLDGVVQQMRCPFLVVHGEDDEQIPLKDAQALYDASGSTDKTLRVFTAEEGGAEHCQVDNRPMGMDYIADWLIETLGLPPR